MFGLVEGFGRKKKVENLNSFLRIFFFWALLFLDSEGSDSSRKWIKKICFFLTWSLFFTKVPVTFEPGLKRLKFETGYFILLLHGGHFG